jgi:archaellum component FlaC
VFNFIGKLSKILFGTMDKDDAKYYNEQIKLLEQNSEDMNTLLKQQLSLVRSSLGAVNNTLAHVEYNGNLLKEGISRVTRYMNTLRSEANEKINLFGAKIEIEGRILRVNNAMNTLQRNLHLLIDGVINAQKGVLQPQVISPVALMEALIKSVSAFPKDIALPFPLSKDSARLLLRSCDLQLYIKHVFLGYVILPPLVNRGNFNIYRLIPIPVPLDRTKSLYVDTGKSFLWIEQARQYCFMTDKEWMDSCKILNAMKYVCKQNQPFLSSHLHENCMLKLLQPRGSVPPQLR